MIHLTWIEDLLAVAESGSLTEAAQRRNVTQPAFSRRIQAIEERLGVTVLDRSNRPARPGEALLGLKDQLRRIAKDLRQVSMELSNTPSIQTKQIIVACQHSLAVSFAPRYSRRLLDKTENISVRIRSGNRDECLWLFTTGQAHIILAYEVSHQPLLTPLNYTEKKTIWNEKIIPVATPYFLENRLKQRSDDKIPVIAYPEGVFMGRFNSETFSETIDMRSEFIRAAETSFTLSAREMALAHLGIAWMPESLIVEELAANRLSDLSFKYNSYPISLVAYHSRPLTCEKEKAAWDILLSYGQDDFTFDV